MCTLFLPQTGNQLNYYHINYRLVYESKSLDSVFISTDSSLPLLTLSLFVAPSGPPTDVTAAALSSTSLLIIWQPPESFERNGIITAYQIHVTTSGNETLNTYMVSGNTRSLQVEGNYAVSFHPMGLMINQ